MHVLKVCQKSLQHFTTMQIPSFGKTRRGSFSVAAGSEYMRLSGLRVLQAKTHKVVNI